jgi:hypothetical protein
MKNYKPCGICKCTDCRDGIYRRASWVCPIFSRQICDVCCLYDSKDPNLNLVAKCKSLKCSHYKETQSSRR